MAQEYGIDIQRWNGTDYDTLKPTPDAHADTHKASGSDPIVMQTGNYGNKTVTSDKLGDAAVVTSKIANNAVTRAKLANDALYSPINKRSASYSIATSDIGKTIFCDSSSSSTVMTVTLSNEVAAGFPQGTEIALLAGLTGTTKLAFGANVGVRGNNNGDIVSGNGKTMTLPKYGMVAIKKIYAGDSNIWLITGQYEVDS